MRKTENTTGRGSLVSVKIFTTVAICLCVIFLSFLVTTDLSITVFPTPVFRPIPPRRKPRLMAAVNKTILFYNDFFGSSYWHMREGDGVFKDLNCPVSDCFFTADRTKFNESAAVAFHVPRVNFPTPEGRPAGQVWLFYAWEAPIHVNKLPASWKNQFNWSLTYHRQSDYFMPYGNYTKRKEPLKRNWTAVVAEKTKAVAWFVSNCHTSSKRMDYVRRLEKIIPVDIWGGCGHNKCGVNERQKCMSIINQTYKFYLGFESSYCEDYITEKMFRYNKYDIVLVVRGGANYSQTAPPGAFINTADFHSPEDLGAYLKYLDQNTTEYIKHLKWKENYYAEEYGLNQMLWCDICKDLTSVSSRTAKMDPYDLWFNDKRCWTPTDI